MKPIVIQFTRAIIGQDDLDVFETIVVDPTEPEDWQLPPDELAIKTAKTWTSVEISNDETIDISVTISAINNAFSMFVRQSDESIAQLSCEGLPIITFRTMGGELIGLQAFDREQYEATSQ